MLGIICIGVVLILAVTALVSRFRTRAFKMGRGVKPHAIALALNPVADWTTATLLSIVSGVCLAFFLHSVQHSL